MKIEIEIIHIYIGGREYINVQMCIHSVQGFSLFQVVLLYDVTSNIYFCSSLREQLFSFQIKKKIKKNSVNVWKVSGVY